MKKQRKHYTPEEKVAILRRHLLEQVPISELCDKHGLQPTVFYRWQKVPHDTRDQIVDFVRRWSEKTEISAGQFIEWLDVTASKFYDWRERYGKVNEHNGWVPRDFWLEDWEKQAIIGFHLKNPQEGYRRLTFMMLDASIEWNNRTVAQIAQRGVHPGGNAALAGRCASTGRVATSSITTTSA